MSTVYTDNILIVPSSSNTYLSQAVNIMPDIWYIYFNIQNTNNNNIRVMLGTQQSSLNLSPDWCAIYLADSRILILSVMKFNNQ